MRPTPVKALYSLWSALTEFWEAPRASRATHIWGKTLCYTLPNKCRTTWKSTHFPLWQPCTVLGPWAALYKYNLSTKLYRKILSLLLSELLQWHSMSNNAKGNKQWYIFLSGMAWYYDKWFYSLLCGHFKVPLLHIKSSIVDHFLNDINIGQSDINITQEALL